MNELSLTLMIFKCTVPHGTQQFRPARQPDECFPTRLQEVLYCLIVIGVNVAEHHTEEDLGIFLSLLAVSSCIAFGSPSLFLWSDS